MCRASNIDLSAINALKRTPSRMDRLTPTPSCCASRFHTKILPIKLSKNAVKPFRSSRISRLFKRIGHQPDDAGLDLHVARFRWLGIAERKITQDKTSHHDD